MEDVIYGIVGGYKEEKDTYFLRKVPIFKVVSRVGASWDFDGTNFFPLNAESRGLKVP